MKETLSSRQTRCEAQLQELALQACALNERVVHMQKQLGTMAQDVRALRHRPGALWDKGITAMIGAAMAGLVSWIISGRAG